MNEFHDFICQTTGQRHIQITHPTSFCGWVSDPPGPYINCFKIKGTQQQNNGKSITSYNIALLFAWTTQPPTFSALLVSPSEPSHISFISDIFRGKIHTDNKFNSKLMFGHLVDYDMIWFFNDWWSFSFPNAAIKSLSKNEHFWWNFKECTRRVSFI
jgi:hypothetical protein